MDSNYQLILRSIQKHVELSEQDEKCLCSFLHPLQVKNKELLLEEGKVADSTFFVNEGCLRSYNIDENGFEHILQFAPPGWWIADLYSVVSKRPGTLNIDALEHSKVLSLKRIDQERLFLELPKIERYFRIITENSLVSHRQRLIDNMSLSATERYDVFCKRYPELIHTLPQKQIAAYIGVTPEFFSKMKSKMK
ncbi:MAG: Crp/Fnr family transcriptional regulator [Bacteroidia bacterium]